MLNGKQILIYRDTAENGTSTEFLGIWYVSYADLDTRYVCLKKSMGERLITESMFNQRCLFAVLPTAEKCYNG